MTVGTTLGLMSAAFGLGVCMGLGWKVDAQRSPRVLEIRKITTREGKLDDLVKQMAAGEARLLEKHGLKSLFHAIGTDAPPPKDHPIPLNGSKNMYFYVLSHESREAAKKSWQGFLNDPEWKALSARFATAGSLYGESEGFLLSATEYSAIK